MIAKVLRIIGAVRKVFRRGAASEIFQGPGLVH